MHNLRPSRLLRLGITAAAGILLTTGSHAELKPALPHRHVVVEIAGEPILSRVRIRLQLPRRVLRGPRGDLFFVDSAAGKVLRLAPNKKPSEFATGLNDPWGICFDKSGNCFVSNFGGGIRRAGSIIRIAPDGRKTSVAQNLEGPKGIAVGPDGRLYAAISLLHRVVAIDENGALTQFASGTAVPEGLCFDSRGNLFVSSSTAGTVTCFAPRKSPTALRTLAAAGTAVLPATLALKGQAIAVWKGLRSPSDLAITPEGDVTVLNSAGTTIDRLRQADGKTEPYLDVPAGTVGYCFDGDGNAVIVNETLKLAIHVKNRLFVPCPHCRKMIPLRIKPNGKRPAVKKPAI